MTKTWAAPTAAGPIDGRVEVPGSKSVTNRALVLAALAAEPTTLSRPLRARDTELMVAALRSLGTSIVDVGTSGPDAGPGAGGGGDWLVTPAPLGGGATIDCGLAGTVMRFVPAVAALATGPVGFDGDEAARRRPMAPVVDALRALGVQVEDGGRAALPFTVHGTGSVRGGRVEVDASGSSQFVSGLLLAGCRFADGITVRSTGAVPSGPHIDMTLAMLVERGVRATRVDAGCWQVEPGLPSGGLVAIEPDVSNAFPFAAAALATRGRVRIAGFPMQSRTQPVAQALAVLTALGAQVSAVGDGLLVDGSAGVRGADLDMSAVGELVPVVAALAALAGSPTSIRGVAHLRGHETDRLAALTRELGRLGADIRETDDGLALRPMAATALHGGEFETYADHRLATAAAVLGLVVPDVRVVDVETTAKTLPGFVRLWTGMLGT